MSKSPKISISFKKEYLPVYQWLKKRDNISSYICQLVLDNMKNGVHADDFEIKVETIVLKLLKARNFVEQDNGIDDRGRQIESLSKAEEDLINSLF